MDNHDRTFPSVYSLGGDAVPVQVRIARPTDKLEDVVAFYRGGLGLWVMRPWNRKIHTGSSAASPIRILTAGVW